MIVRLQHFDILDTLDVDQSSGPKLQTDMMLAHLDGVHVRLHSSTNCDALIENCCTGPLQQFTLRFFYAEYDSMRLITLSVSLE